MLTLKPSDLWAVSKTESISITTTTHTKTKPIDHQTQNELISAGTSPISILRTKNRSLSTRTPKPSQIRSLPQKSSLSRRHYCNQFNSIPTLESSQFRCLHTKTKLISIHIPKTKPIFSDPHAKNNSIPILALNSSQFRSPQ